MSEWRSATPWEDQAPHKLNKHRRNHGMNGGKERSIRKKLTGGRFLFLAERRTFSMLRPLRVREAGEQLSRGSGE